MVVTQSTPSVLIRPAREDDMDTVYEFMCDLEETVLDLTRFQAIFRQNLANPMVYYLIAEWTGVAVGFVSCHVQHLLHHVGKVGEIQELYVRPAHRNQQIGRQLAAALDALAVREAFVNLEVTTNQKRIAAVQFYEQAHFACTHFKLVKSIQS